MRYTRSQTSSDVTSESDMVAEFTTRDEPPNE